MWLDGVELVALADAPRKLARILAESEGPIPSARCDRMLSRALGSGASKQAKLRFAEGGGELRAGGEEGAGGSRGVIEGTRKGYRLSVKAWVA